MEHQRMNNAQAISTIDLLHIAQILWRRVWIILVSALLAAALGFGYATYGVRPTYSSFVKLYVNNSSFKLGSNNFSISSADLSAAQSLLKTYGDILVSRSTLERIIQSADVKYSWKELCSMISYEASNGTEIMKVTVTCEDPYEASKIANTIAKILPIRIAEIIDGASMVLVDSAVPDLNNVTPSITDYTIKGLLIGLVLSVAVLTAFALLDNTVHDEEFLRQNYPYPILGEVPNIIREHKSYEYYSDRRKSAKQKGGGRK